MPQGFPGGTDVKNLPAVSLALQQESWVQSLGQEDSLEKRMATHSSILAWRIYGQRSLVGYSPRGHKESDTTERWKLLLSLSLSPSWGFPMCNLYPFILAPSSGITQNNSNVLAACGTKKDRLCIYKSFTFHLVFQKDLTHDDFQKFCFPWNILEFAKFPL